MKYDHDKYHLLIVEDNPGDELIITEYLDESFSNLELTVLKSFKETKAFFQDKSNKNKIDACLLDLSLPDNKGETLIRDTLLLSDNTPIIVLTGYSDLTFSIKSLKLGVTDYLIKDEINPLSLYKSIIYSLERKKYISRLEESEFRYSSLFQFSPVPKILIQNSDKSIIQANRAASELYGYSETEILQLEFSDLFTSEGYANFVNSINKPSANSSLKVRRYRHKTKTNEEIYVDINSQLISVENTDCSLVVCNDVTEKVLFEQQMDRAILKTQEDERNEIGAELHDNACQLIATSQLYLSMLEGNLKNNVETHFAMTNQLIQKALNEIRGLSHQMAPAFFDDSTLNETLPLLLETFNIKETYTVQLTFTEDIYRLQLRKDIHLNIFRILQEQLRNIQKYSNAKNVVIQLTSSKSTIKMIIQDDGVGFDPLTITSGIGLSNMKRRADLLNGLIQINSSEGNGCSIEVEFPL